ncbi:DUF4402 domain-containing protein [Salinimicrobium sediminilitoris]|uniref:DUF4402 domain-containing protein n=1 Tax=Salinimicrobium sediminilitoris TaxID=2876715 RepID=UPI001E54813B|nr:DUF4402 domain-containing protein [Salinimicrobium sediminilitoris]MCC8358642.1 DUF4402 domain-containing protein [Salinimicrobium sediminilitoris]
MNKVLCLFIFLLISTQTFAQASASATVESRATVIDPIKIDKTVDLDFGNVISAYNPGTVILTPEGSRVAYGVQISSSFPGTVNPAQAVVTHGNNNYSITLPESFILFNSENPDQQLIIDQFTVAPEEGVISDIIKIGARLNLEANQSAGFYTNSSGFNVTVSYN